jgi:SAM-dependent methyltransferase
MRIGHPQIKEGDDYMLQLFGGYLEERKDRISVLNVGAGSGYFARQLAEAFSRIDVIAHEDHPDAATELRRRLEGSRVQLFIDDFERWNEPVDVVLSWGAHHHLSRSYLEHTRRILAPGGVLVLGDEFCPEYCRGVHAERIDVASEIFVANGYVVTSPDEIAGFRERGEIPEAARELENLRRRALWRWYQYVIDTALERGCLEVVLYELRAARDDLDTSCGDEHKLSPRIVQRELQLAGFRQRSSYSVGQGEPAELQSFFIYEYVPSDPGHASKV